MAVLCVAQFVLVLDATIVATALSTVAASLGLSAAGLAWVLTGYTLTFGGFLVLGGRVSDLAGPRQSLQAVLRGACAGETEVRWLLARIA